MFKRTYSKNTQDFDNYIGDYLFDLVPGYREQLLQEIEDDCGREFREEFELQEFIRSVYQNYRRYPIICKQTSKTDGRGKHDKAYREKRKLEIMAKRANLVYTVACINPNCTNGYIDASGTTCLTCGWINDTPNLSDGVNAGYYHVPEVVYNSGFYFMERANCWRGKSPRIPPESLREILTAIHHHHECQRIHWSVMTITRELIYEVVNKLYGQKKIYSSLAEAQAEVVVDIDEDDSNELDKLTKLNNNILELNKLNRKKLVYRERWIAIKYIMCCAENRHIFSVAYSQLFIRRFEQSYPTDELINLLNLMIRILDRPFKDVLYASKRDGLKRHNRPSRDLVVIFLLYGIHPALYVIYGTDYWNPPITRKSLLDNQNRLKLLLQQARESHSLLPWPDESTSIYSILALNEYVVNMDELTQEIRLCFPRWLQEYKGELTINREFFRIP